MRPIRDETSPGKPNALPGVSFIGPMGAMVDTLQDGALWAYIIAMGIMAVIGLAGSYKGK